MKKLNLLLSIVVLLFVVSSCKKSLDKYPIDVRMTDASAVYDAVNIDLQGVEITGSNGTAVTMDANTGIYNLLQFSNGLDTLIATGGLDVAEVSQIRLILGSNNTIVVDGVTYPLSTPSAEQSGLKLQVHQTLQAGVVYTILLDFDANKSIVATGNNTYKLKPVIRTIDTAMSGAIKGKITPVGAEAVISISSDTELLFSTMVSASGDFILKGLPAGTYTLNVSPEMPYHEVNQVDIQVTTGSTTNVGTIALQ